MYNGFKKAFYILKWRNQFAFIKSLIGKLLVVQNLKIAFNSVGAIISILLVKSSLEKAVLNRMYSSSFLYESTLEWKKTKMRWYV